MFYLSFCRYLLKTAISVVIYYISEYHALLALLLRRRYGGQGYAIRVLNTCIYVNMYIHLYIQHIHTYSDKSIHRHTNKFVLMPKKHTYIRARLKFILCTFQFEFLDNCAGRVSLISISSINLNICERKQLLKF